LGAMQDDAAANSSAMRRVFFKKEAVRLAVIINNDLFRAAPLEMPIQDLSQFAPQEWPPGNLMEIFPAAEFIAARDRFRDRKPAPLRTIHSFSGFCKGMEWRVGKSHIFFPAMHLAVAIILKPGEPDLQHLLAVQSLRQPQDSEGTAVVGNQPALGLLLQLLEFAAQDSKPERGFSPPGHRADQQEFLATPYFYHCAVIHKIHPPSAALPCASPPVLRGKLPPYIALYGKSPRHLP